uniref:protein ACCELERATED CELL DEATH 6-like n=1 Tax=Erigeron canadensis TaxID=72917 RepID=UPI001CB9215F|nr:protein ACCELERATED CELL DEATH 6-like [Erigeron canadensis]
MSSDDDMDGNELSEAVQVGVISGVGRILRNRVLDKIDEPMVYDDLRNGNELCRGRMIPMSPQLIAQVKSIYRICQLELQNRNSTKTPLMVASILGLADMVWGFIECSKETRTNLHTQRRGLSQDFLWLRNRDGKTALDMAISDNHVEVAKLLLSNASYGDLESEWNSKGKILFPLLHDPKYDGFIFRMLEKDTIRAHFALPIYMPLHNQQGRSYLNLDELILSLHRWNPLEYTILHIVSKFGVVNYVKDILIKDPSLISRHNSEGETPVYVAAKEGHVDVLQTMLDHLEGKQEDIESLLIRPEDKNNALHIAIQNHHAPVVFWLLKNFPELANHNNVLKESPLYLAAERSYFEIVKLILNECGEISFKGPNGKTALHAAIISNSAECVDYLLQVSPYLINEKDENDWTPWHYAVHYNSSLAMKELLNADNSIGYQLVTQDDIVTSALHIAASEGHLVTMKVIMSKCPRSSDFIDSKGRNILHVAIESEQTEAIEFIFQDESLTSLINQKDSNGNTPAHLLAVWNFEMMEKVIDSRVNIRSLNNEKHTPLDMIASNENKKRLIKAIAKGTDMGNKTSSSSSNISMSDLYEKELEGKQKKAKAHLKMVDNLVLVVTLIATASFAAAFTVPGGFDSDDGSKQGTPYLLRKAAFQVFVISNAIAFSCSCSVLLAHIVLLIHRNRYDVAGETERKYIDGRIVFMYFLTGVALLSMLIAFVTGFYVVLLPSLWLAIFVCFVHPLRAYCAHGRKCNFNLHMGCGGKVKVNGKDILIGKACEDPKVLINWDGVHYTQVANEWVFNQIVNGSLSDPPLPLGLASYKQY